MGQPSVVSRKFSNKRVEQEYMTALYDFKRWRRFERWFLLQAGLAWFASAVFLRYSVTAGYVMLTVAVGLAASLAVLKFVGPESKVKRKMKALRDSGDVELLYA